MNDAKQRALTVGDRITVPAVVQSLDGGTLTIALLLPQAGMADPITVANSGCVLRCGPGDNNGLDDSIVGDSKTQADAHYAADMASVQSQLETLQAQLAQKQAETAAAIAKLDTQLAMAQAKYDASLSALQPPPAA